MARFPNRIACPHRFGERAFELTRFAPKVNEPDRAFFRVQAQ